METPRTAQHFWDREVVAPTHSSWMEDPAIRESISRSIDERGMWPVEWFESWLGGRRFRRGLSVGCGSGALERDLVKRGLVARVDALDGSMNSLKMARDLAAAEGFSSRIRYFAYDFNRAVLPWSTYDAVFIHQALHHVENLEILLRAVMMTLRRRGLLYLDEYIGPSRDDWNDELIAPHRAVFASIPAEERRSETLELPIQMDDPSEAIRSSEILRELQVGFHVAAVRPYGGNLLSVLFPNINAAPSTMHRLIDEEKKLLASGQESYYSVIVARPKRGLAKVLAWWRYRKAIRGRLGLRPWALWP